MTRTLALLGLLALLAVPSAVAAPDDEPCEVVFITPLCAPGHVAVTGAKACGVTLVPAGCVPLP